MAHITAARAVSLDGLFAERIAATPDAIAYRDFDAATGKWRDTTWREAAREVGRWCAALQREGLQPGDRVAVSLRNGKEWVFFDQAALRLGLVSVPLYTDDRPENSAFILADCGAKLLLLQDFQRWRRLAPAVAPLPDLARVVLLEGEGDGDERVRPLAHWLPAEGDLPHRDIVDPDAVATIVYTSGTTGRPKGVMLSHHNILSVAEAGLAAVEIRPDDLFLSFLPLSHTYERTVGYYLPMLSGSSVAHSRSPLHLAEDLREVRPTLLVAVPRIFERVYARIRQQLAGEPRWRQELFEFTVAIGWHRFEQRQGRAPWSPRLLWWPLLDLVVAAKVRKRLGGRLRLVVSGGAPLPLEVAKLFIGLGVPLLQGYGLTESSPQVSVNRLDDNDPASVGAPLPGIQVAIGADDELLVKSPGVMRGYWHHPEATAATIRDGWLHTGDQARIEGGRIYITGRIKDVLVLSNGEKVSPQEMEMAIALDPLFEQVMVIGEGRPFLTALLVLDPGLWPELARGLALDPADPAGLVDRRLLHQIQQRVQQRLHGFPAWAKIRRVILTLEGWNIDNDLMTPTLKVKRKKVMEHYGAEIERTYTEGLRR